MTEVTMEKIKNREAACKDEVIGERVKGEGNTETLKVV